MFDFWIASPLKEGRLWGSERLKDLIRATCLRRTKKMMDSSLALPRRHERIEMVDFHQTDHELYTFFKDSTSKVAAGISSRDSGVSRSDFFQESNILSLINLLRLICDHGKSLLPPSALAAWETRDRTSTDKRLMRNLSSRCDICDAEMKRASLGALEASLEREPSVCARCTHSRQDSPREGETSDSNSATRGSLSGDFGIRSPAVALVRPSAKIEALLRNLALDDCTNPCSPIKR